MKYFGSIMAFTHERNTALLNTYRRLIADAPFIDLGEIARQVVNQPAPRFWVSEDRARAVVSAINRGLDILAPMRTPKREMFTEIHRRVSLLQADRPDTPLRHLVAEVINQPAPKFYLEPSTALIYIFKIRNGRNNPK